MKYQKSALLLAVKAYFLVKKHQIMMKYYWPLTAMINARCNNRHAYRPVRSQQSTAIDVSDFFVSIDSFDYPALITYLKSVAFL